MKIGQTKRGFAIVTHPVYHGTDEKDDRLIQESSDVGLYDDSLDLPGSSYLWVGSAHHLDRAEVCELITLLQGWVDNKQLPRVST